MTFEKVVREPLILKIDFSNGKLASSALINSSDASLYPVYNIQFPDTNKETPI